MSVAPALELDDAALSGLWAAMSAEYRTRAVAKSGSSLMVGCGWALSRLRLMTAAEFLEGYTTVIGRTIYCPYTPGSAADAAGRWGQAATCVHEHQHVVQSRRDGFARFASRYLGSSRARALYEAEAYGCDIELMRWAGRPHRSIDRICAGLVAYGCDADDIAAARQILEEYATRDAVSPVNEATRFAVEWLTGRQASSEAGDSSLPDAP